MALENMLLAVIFPMICGAYAFTWLTYSKVSSTLETFQNNHLAHIEADVKLLKEKLEL